MYIATPFVSDQRVPHSGGASLAIVSMLLLVALAGCESAEDGADPEQLRQRQVGTIFDVTFFAGGYVSVATLPAMHAARNR